uniref:Jacalin-type lectin domain-containing protein n=1 Tax=Oryctolagus cuniculus TaxID=9986 RepID=G1U8R8_RABIT
RMGVSRLEETLGAGGGRTESEPREAEPCAARPAPGPALGDFLSPSIQVKVGWVWDAVYGTTGWKTQELILQPEEHITSVQGQYLLKIWRLTLCTNHSRCVEFGKAAGKPFSALPTEDGQVLKGIFGFLASPGFKGLGFRWDYLLERDYLQRERNLPSTGSLPR